ncbi:hypothetical protein [Paraflavitalea speifideaquila]|uniref:hypothetical protein n=1 Tax=Paraflavitalea speifideaquila TaxID=3076558 RepID=UPI0028EC4842|nr:hypothetical protein [Paraflavitalea speifideiaquila]
MRRQRNIETCSPDYGSIRWVRDTANCTLCPKPVDWWKIDTFRCEIVGGVKTGYAEQLEINRQPCLNNDSASRWVRAAFNCSMCGGGGAAGWKTTGTPPRCVTSGGVNTGQQEREERDTALCSPTYNQTRWMADGVNCTNCPMPAGWKATANLPRCVTSGGVNTGQQEREERDTALCSPTYNQTRWVADGVNCTNCPMPAGWKATGASLRCAISGGVNTGQQEREERDTALCSPTYNQTRWVAIGINCISCPRPSSWKLVDSFCLVSDPHKPNDYTGYQRLIYRDTSGCNRPDSTADRWNPGGCRPCVYARIEYSNEAHVYDPKEDLTTASADIHIRFYSDSTFTSPYPVYNLSVSYYVDVYQGSYMLSRNTETIICNGTAAFIGRTRIQEYVPGQETSGWLWHYHVPNSSVVAGPCKYLGPIQ